MKLFLLLGTLPFLAALQDPAPEPDFRAELKALRAEYQKAEQEYYRPYSEARTDEERRKVKLDPAKNPAPIYLAKFRDLAERAKGTEGAASALLEVFSLAQRSGKRDDARQAVATLVESHVESPSMERLATLLRYAGHQIGDAHCRSALEAIQEKSPLPKAKAAATFILAVQGMANDEAASRAAFVRLQEEFADTPYAAKAGAFLFELDHLQVGKPAPDFEATDEKGEKYKLSDYRGKVTVIDFWGFW